MSQFQHCMTGWCGAKRIGKELFRVFYEEGAERRVLSCVCGDALEQFLRCYTFCVGTFGRPNFTVGMKGTVTPRMWAAFDEAAFDRRSSGSAGCGCCWETADELKMPDDPGFGRAFIWMGSRIGGA